MQDENKKTDQPDKEKSAGCLVRAKTCNGCLALADVQGYGLECRYDGNKYKCTSDGIPLQPCPKPKTYAQWIKP